MRAPRPTQDSPEIQSLRPVRYTIRELPARFPLTVHPNGTSFFKA
jgi:hypothetical protein